MFSLSDYHLVEVLSESFSRAETGVCFALDISCLKIPSIKTCSSDMAGEPLNAPIWPSFNSFHELSLMLIVELFDALLKFDLSGPQRLDLLELL
jgi:hypothetical protein